MIQLIRAINISPIIECYSKLESSIEWSEFGHKGKQAGLQYSAGDNCWSSAVGIGHGDQTKYNNLNPAFLDTIFEELINEFNMFRTRLMWVKPFSCYSMHKDLTPRIHIPIITNVECYFVFKKGLISHLPAGGVYKTNTLEKHTFMNCSDQHRLHLVGCVT
jgi:hypothetical protein